MAYITELHCHTAEVSDCGRSTAQFVADRYVAAGYTSLTIMNHLSKYTFNGSKHKYTGSQTDWQEKIAFFMDGIGLVEKAAVGRIHILWGIELRVSENDNDYLVYGISGDFLRANPDILEVSPKEAAARVHRAGGLFFQAHPFRNSITVKPPELLDGIEVYNGHPGHDSRNDIALMWAKKYNLKMVSGTDFHYDSHIPSGGIVTDRPLTTNEELLAVLKSGEYGILNSGMMPLGSKK